MAATGSRFTPRRIRRGLSRRAATAYARVQDAVERRTQPERWPNHLLFVAGMPKSGTTWLAELLEGVPHYRSRPFSDPDGCVLRHDICDAVFESLPGDLYSVVKLHTRATPENLAVLDHFGLPAVVMHRDLRDQAVSRYFHVKVDPEHRHFELYNTASEAEGLRHAIEHSTGEYREWIEQWLPVLEAQPERFLEVRYEWLREDPAGQLTRALAFF